MSGNIFHNHCDKKGPTICLFKNEKGYIFGGYISNDWKGNEYGGWYSAGESFIFTLTNMYNISPTKFPTTGDSIFDGYDNGPIFGDIFIGFNSNNNVNFPNHYEDVLGKGHSIFTGDKNNKKFDLKEIEVFKIIK